MSPHDAFATSIRMLNAQYWLMLTLTEHANGQFSVMPELVNLRHQPVLASIFHHAPSTAKKIRVTNSQLSLDMVQLTNATKLWLPAYFIVLGKSIAESICKDLLEARYQKGGPDTAAINAMVNPKRPSRKDEDKVIEYLSQSVTRGAFAELQSLVGLHRALDGKKTLVPTLKRYAAVRNALAHDLADGFQKGPPVASADFTTYVGVLQKLVETVADAP